MGDISSLELVPPTQDAAEDLFVPNLLQGYRDAAIVFFPEAFTTAPRRSVKATGQAPLHTFQTTPCHSFKAAELASYHSF